MRIATFKVLAIALALLTCSTSASASLFTLTLNPEYRLESGYQGTDGRIYMGGEKVTAGQPTVPVRLVYDPQTGTVTETVYSQPAWSPATRITRINPDGTASGVAVTNGTTSGSRAVTWDAAGNLTQYEPTLGANSATLNPVIAAGSVYLATDNFAGTATTGVSTSVVALALPPSATSEFFADAVSTNGRVVTVGAATNAINGTTNMSYRDSASGFSATVLPCSGTACAFFGITPDAAYGLGEVDGLFTAYDFATQNLLSFTDEFMNPLYGQVTAWIDARQSGSTGTGFFATVTDVNGTVYGCSSWNPSCSPLASLVAGWNVGFTTAPNWTGVTDMFLWTNLLGIQQLGFLATGSMHLQGTDTPFQVGYSQSVTTTPVPELSTLTMLGMGLSGAIAQRLRRRRQSTDVDSSSGE